MKSAPELQPDLPGPIYTPSDLTAALPHLKDSQLAFFGDWRRLVQSCASATDGAGWDAFADWAKDYSDFRVKVARLKQIWETYDPATTGITYDTLNRLLVQAEAPADVIKGAGLASLKVWPVEQDRPTQDGVPDYEWLYEMNREYTLLATGGTLRVVYEVPDGNGGTRLESLNLSDFKAKMQTRTVQDGQNKRIGIGEAWLKNPQRNEADGVTLDATKEPNELVEASGGRKLLNRWQGFGVQSRDSGRPFEATMLHRLLFEVLCRKNREHYDYLVRWCVWKAQNPDKRPEIAIILRGTKGTGKGTFGALIVKIFGAHGIVIDNAEHQLLGRFKGHLINKLIVFADEAMWAGRKDHEGTLKKLITDEDTLLEDKNVRAVPHKNRLGVIIATNEDWAVPATMDERRFFVLETADVWPKDSQNWVALYAELDDDGGREAFLHHLLTEPKQKHPRYDVPQTAALGTQKLQTETGVPRWLGVVLSSGEPSALGDAGQDADTWAKESVQVRPNLVVEAFRQWIQQTQKHKLVTPKGLLIDLKKFGVTNRKSDGDRYWVFPAVPDMQRTYESVLGVEYFDRDREDDDAAEPLVTDAREGAAALKP